jgi:hypothetical protein
MNPDSNQAAVLRCLDATGLNLGPVGVTRVRDACVHASSVQASLRTSERHMPRPGTTATAIAQMIAVLPTRRTVTKRSQKGTPGNAGIAPNNRTQ